MEKYTNLKSRIIRRATGWCLGPLLFILYINDLPNATKNQITFFGIDSIITVRCNDDNIYKSNINSILSLVIN